MNENKYEVYEDSEISSAGFSNRSRFDLERERIEDEMARYSDKSFRPTITVQLLILTLVAGLHRLTNGKIFSGLVFGLTLGGFGIWFLIDWFLIISGKFTDKYGKPINYPAVYRLDQELKALEKRHANGEL